jgi:hypothetical protein
MWVDGGCHLSPENPDPAHADPSPSVENCNNKINKYIY